MNWYQFENFIRELVPENYKMKGDFYGWYGKKKPEQINKVAVVVDLLPFCNFSSYDVVISHHKPFFTPDFPVFVVHTPLDFIEWGCHFQLAKNFGFTEIKKFDSSIGVYVEKETDVKELLENAIKTLSPEPINYYFPSERVKKIAFFSGCGFNFPLFIEKVIGENIDMVISGDLVHHTAVRFSVNKIGYIDIGHYKSEIPGIKEFIKRIQRKLTAEFVDAKIPQFHLCLC
ncbi:Nif3-like dinuclear metal center hexameric protein [Desulfurobacterium atlanticum]|uniref:Putative GTP cyclohydrolase 1 type 2, NIF3 family n=1 Tax=Desulfurobacterium atlanticum TaxID=240169 RepID=A0A239A641_9BACT|nr:Nif3-like dinuclear metal center hexameric protein [Desulfurobacterium atlanticum]SNR90363.1 Putative GTP cyclohydrolase 1 type 2, NIF3 family [Desulfurobacterium atlanticum]